MAGTEFARMLWTPTQAEFDGFAVLSGDDNPIHVDAVFSARTRFGRTVSHGMLLYAPVWAAIRHAAPGQAILTQTLMFPNPAFAGEELCFTLEARDLDVLDIKMRRAADEELTLIGECRLAPTYPPASVMPAVATGRKNDGVAIEGIKLGRIASLTRTFTLEDTTAFAELAGLASAPAGIPEPLIGALFSHLLGTQLPGAGTNYLKQDMTFLGQAPYGDSLIAEVEVIRLRPEKHLVDLATTCRRSDGTEICRGRALVLVKDVG